MNSVFCTRENSSDLATLQQNNIFLQMCPDFTHVVIKTHLTFESHPGYTVRFIIRPHFGYPSLNASFKSNNSDADTPKSPGHKR